MSLHFKYTIMSGQKTYAVKEYLRYRVVSGAQQILLSWVGYKEQTWEPIESLFLNKQDEPYMNAIRQKYRKICKEYQAKGLKVDNIEIINPHLKNAKILQKKLDYKYMDPTTKSFALDDQSSLFQKEDGDDSPCSKKEGRKTIKKQLKTKTVRQQALENLRRIDKFVQEQQEKTLNKGKAMTLSINEQNNLPCLMRYDFGASFKECPSASQQGEEYLRDLMKKKMKDEPPVPFYSSQKSEQLLFKLLQKSKIVRNFWRQQKGRRVGYFQVAFQGMDSSSTGIFHEDLLMQCCPSKVIKLLNSK